MSVVAVLGAGAWGTALAVHLVEQRARARLWSWQATHAERLRTERENVAFFPGVLLPEGVVVTHDLQEAVQGADVVIVVVPTPAVRATLQQLRRSLSAKPLLVFASKGIETGTLMLLTEVAEDVLGSDIAERTVALSGPSFAQEVARGLPTNLVAAAGDLSAALEVQRLLSGERLRIYTSDDPLGVQVGGALKNVIAIATGASDGLGFGHNTRAALITRGLAEMARLAVAKGGSTLTLAGLAGLGDLVLTATAELSRNRTLGFEMARGRSLDEVVTSLGHVAEGVTTAKSAHDLAAQLGVELPICSQVYRVLYEGKPVDEAVRELLLRPVGKEWR
ncbi:MAG TPA: NAD(P)H-dependent glycerol-3-phosphate dehydrogenase [Polyangiaceae bacterium]|nr:NAD(P)H-dependent glycerol-3-phosphate dehydrogenase [Polyangiaceae bacterium]